MQNKEQTLSVHLKKSDNYIHDKAYQKAKILLTKLLKKSPHNVNVMSKLAELYLRLALFNDAIKLLNKALSLTPKNADFIEMLAIGYMLNKKYEKAERLFLSLEKPYKQQAYYGLSALYTVKGDYERAHQYSVKAIKLLPFSMPTLKSNPADNLFDKLSDKPVILVVQSIGKNTFELHNLSYKIDTASNNMYNYLQPFVTLVTVFTEQWSDDITSDLSLNNIDLIYNGIADCDGSSEALKTLNTIITRVNKPVINTPEQLGLTSRDANYQRLHLIDGLVFPNTLKIHLDDTDKNDFQALLASHNIQLPVLIRRLGTHVGKSFEKMESVEDFEHYKQHNPGSEAYISQFYLLAHKGVYRRFRIYCINQEIFPGTVYYGKDWNVHVNSNIPLAKHAFLNDQKEFYDNFEQFIKPYRAAIDSIVVQTPLDYFGIDFDILAGSSEELCYETKEPCDEGKEFENKDIIVFEVNASMNVNHGNEKIQAQLTSAITRLFEGKLGREL
jgi:hypothetical protein